MTTLPILHRTPALSQRPKLRLDTKQNCVFGKKSTSLRLDTLSAVSPTIRNTFSNTIDPPATSTRPRLSVDSSCDSLEAASTPSSASTLASAVTSASNDESATIVIPYKQPHNLTSILRNSPAQSSLPRKMTTARPLFPAEKKVSFRTPLEEEIKNVKYTLAHSDLNSSSSTISSLATSSPDSENSEPLPSMETSSVSGEHSSPPTLSKPTLPSLGSTAPREPRAGDKRDSSESDSDSCPETPVAGRRKRRRDWHWTLSPLASAQSASTSSSTSDANTSEDSN